jgi:hypothetical protein
MPFLIFVTMERLFIGITGIPGNDWQAIILLGWKDGLGGDVDIAAEDESAKRKMLSPRGLKLRIYIHEYNTRLAIICVCLPS